MALLGKNVLFADRDTPEIKLAAIVIKDSDSGEGAGYSVIKVFNPDGSSQVVEAVLEGQPVGNSSGTFTLVE